MPKGKKYFTAALAVVKAKKISEAAMKKKELKKQLSSSESEYSSSEYDDSEGSSYTSGSDQEGKNTPPPPRKKEPPLPNKPSTGVLDDGDSSDSSFSNGCGEYRRREDLTPDSSVASSSDDNEESSHESGSSSYESESEYSSSQQSQQIQAAASSGEESDSDYSSSENDEPQSSNKSLNGRKGTNNESVITNKSKALDSENTDEPKKMSFFTKRPSFSGVAKNAAPSSKRRPSTDSRGSQESMSEASRSSKASEPSRSSKGSKVSESSSRKKKLSFGAVARAAVATAKVKKTVGKSVDAVDEDEGSSSEVESSSSEDSYPSRSSKGSSKVSERSKASNKYADEESLASSKYSRKSKSSDASRSSKASKSSNTSDSKNKQNGITAPSLFDEDQKSMMRRGSGSGGGAGRGRGAQVGVGSLGPGKSGRQAKIESSSSSEEESDDTFGSLLQKARSVKDIKAANEPNNKEHGPDAMKKYKDSAELSHSFKTKSLKNANANLRTSFTDEQQHDASGAKAASSSRFAAMMKDLKSSSVVTKPFPTPSSTPSDGDGDDKSDSDDVHIFQAPKILPDDDVPFEQKENSKAKGEKQPEDKKSRFRTRSESMKKILRSKTEPAIEKEESSKSTDSEEGSDVEVDEEESDEESVEDNHEESFTTESFGEERQAGSGGTFDEDSSEEYSTEDEDEYYEEDQAMTILTPITEVDNETIASTIKPKLADDDSVGKFNSLISKASIDLSEEKTDDREESCHTSEGTSDSASSHSSTSSSDKVGNCITRKGDGAQNSGHHEPVIISGVDKKYEQNGMSNQSTHLMPDVERSSMPEVIARVKSNDPSFKAINLDESDLNDFNATRFIFSLNENKHITHISLAQNNLGDGSAASLAHVLHGNENIIYLCLRGNQIRDKGARAMGAAMEENSTLAYLDLHDNNISPALLKAVERREDIPAPSTPFSPSPPTGKENGTLPEANHSKNSHGTEVEDSSYSSAQSSLDSSVLEKSEKATSIFKNLLEIDESVCASAAKDNGKTFETAISSAMESDERSVDEDSLLLALSLSLYNLDSEWALNTAAGGTNNLGDRKRIAPWNITERESVTDSVGSDTSGLADPEGKEGERNKLLCMKAFRNIRKNDPRWQIRKFFNDMSVFGGVLNDMSEESSDEGSSIFTVWRPTSTVAIAKMMRGEGVGKGLEIKGKSAKEGELAGFIPFLQIHEEEHKNRIRTIGKGDRTKIFFKKESWRDEVGEFLSNVSKEMTLGFTKAKFAMARSKYGCDPETILQEEHYAGKAMSAELDDPKVIKIDAYAPQVFGIEVSCRVLWKGLVERKDISRCPGSKLATGRESQAAFQDMNFAALRLKNSDAPLPVIYQCAEEDPFDARMMVMAYEEERKVIPVVSDFDCFLIGSRKFHYADPMSPEQVDLLDWCVSQIEWILESHTQTESWTARWLAILKFAAKNNFFPAMPQFGFGDPTSYSMIEASVKRSAKSYGAVRHGAECFNYFFPQELDEHFLVVFPGNKIWKYVSAKELQTILSEKIRQGYTFPLNPKWLLCDPGWISLFKQLLQSNEPSIQHSIDLWFPPDSGLRERILDINKRFPNGFESDDDSMSQCLCMAEQEYDRYLVIQRAKRKIISFIYWKDLLRDVRERATSDANMNCLDALQSLEFLGERRQELAKEKSSNLESRTLEEIQNLSFYV